MRNKFSTRLISGVFLSAAVCAAAVSPALAAGNVAGWVAKSQKLGPAPAAQSVAIAVNLVLADPAGLKQLVSDVSTPSSKLYGRYLSSDDFGKRFAPAAADVAAVEKLLESAGMKDVQVGAHGAYVTATATVAQLRTTFHVTQNIYSYKGLKLRANAEEPTLPRALAGKVLSVAGLDESTSLRQPMHRSATSSVLKAPAAGGVREFSADAIAAATPPTPPPVAANAPSPHCNTYYGSNPLAATLSTPADVYGATIPWLNCGYTPQDIRASYGLDKVKYDGKGVTVAIVDAYASPTLLADSNRYAAQHGLPTLVSGKNFSQIIPQGIYSVSPDETCMPYGWWEEESLDMAAVHGSAPGATILYVGARDCNTSLDNALFNVLYNHLADVVTNSYGYNGEELSSGYIATYDQALMAGAAQGVTVLFSSGDDGDLSLLNGLASGSFPATSPYVTAVGGTTLEVRDQQGDKREYGWGTYRAFLADATVNSAKSITTSGVTETTAYGLTFDDFSYYSGSGGGISLTELQPAYQAKTVPVALANTINLANGGSEPLATLNRVTPDVAMVADPYTGYLFGETFTIAGDVYDDHGCTAISKTEEYCEGPIGGTSLASPLMAGVIAVMNQKRAAAGEPAVGFANPLFYKHGSGGSATNQTLAALNQIEAPKEPVALLRGYASDPTRVRLVTINSVPLLITLAPFPVEVCDLPVCLGINELFNFTSDATTPYTGVTPHGYNDVTGLGVPWVPNLIGEQ